MYEPKVPSNFLKNELPCAGFEPMTPCIIGSSVVESKEVKRLSSRSRQVLHQLSYEDS